MGSYTLIFAFEYFCQSLAESPIQRQIREKQEQLEKEKHINKREKGDKSKKERKHRKHDRDRERKTRKEGKKETIDQQQDTAKEERIHVVRLM